jgi:Fe-S cluster biogenesis protein NfuA
MADSTRDVDLRAAGERIEALLGASGVFGSAARERAEELVRVVTELYGAGLERLLDILHVTGRLDAEVLAALAADDLVASLLLVHGLHPQDLATRVEQALRSLRPGLRKQGVDVELTAIDTDGTVRLRLVGAAGGCGTASVREAVESAVEAAAPDVAGVVVSTGPSVIPVSSLRSRLSTRAAP